MRPNKQKRIVITGGSGFIGTELIKKLKRDNYHNLIVIDKHPSHLEVDTAVGDFSDTEFLRNHLRKGDTVIHLACTTIPSTSENDKARDVQENVLGTLRLLDACRDSEVDKIVFISSGGTVYGDHGEIALTESHPKKPISAHGTMKLAIENYLKVYNHLHGLKYVILRVSNPYGRSIETAKKQGIIDIFLRKALNDEPIEIWGDGQTVRDYIHIEDLADLIEQVIGNDIANETFNAGTSQGTSINDLLGIIERIAGKKLDVRYLNNRSFDIRHNVLDISKAKNELGWEPKTNIQDGVKKVYQDLKEKKQSAS